MNHKLAAFVLALSTVLFSCASSNMPQSTMNRSGSTSSGAPRPGATSSQNQQTNPSNTNSGSSSGTQRSGATTGQNQQTNPSNTGSGSSSGSQRSGATQGSSSGSSSAQKGLGGLTNDQMVSGLKEALSLGAQNSSNKLSLADGYFKNLAVKIMMPPEAKEVESKLRQLGMGKLVDDAILSMNRAAESAAKDAAPIFLGAIKSMSVNDAVGILTGPNDAATQYLKKTTSSQLTQKFRPVIDAALKKTDATKYWSDVFTNYNKIPFVTKVNPDLNSYVTQKALDGLFYEVAQEEAKIRKDPVGTANSIIEQVFGAIKR
jgi:hypothetical protein